MHTEQNAPPFSPLPHTPPPPMNLLGPILYKFSPWVTWHFPGWFKWGFKEYWKVRFSQMTKVCWDSQTLAWRGPSGPSRPMPCPCGHALLKGPIQNQHYNYCVINSSWKWSNTAPEAHNGPRSFQIWIWHPKKCPTPTVLGVPSNFCFIKFLPKSTPEAPEPHRAPFWPPLRLRVRVEGVQPH